MRSCLVFVLKTYQLQHMHLRLILLTCLALLAALPLRAQIDPDELPGDARAQYEAFKIAFFTRRLSLTSAEAKVFWPVYDEYTGALADLRRRKRAKQAEMRRAFDASSEAELEALADAYLALVNSEADIRTRYHTRFKQVLPIRKVLLLYKAEQAFKRELLEEIRRRRQGGGGRFRN